MQQHERREERRRQVTQTGNQAKIGSTPFFSALLLLHAVRLRIPRVVQLRMLMNAAIDLAIGFIPLLGDLMDFGWKANVRNLALLERYARPGARATAETGRS